MSKNIKKRIKNTYGAGSKENLLLLQSWLQDDAVEINIPKGQTWHALSHNTEIVNSTQKNSIQCGAGMLSFSWVAAVNPHA